MNYFNWYACCLATVAFTLSWTNAVGSLVVQRTGWTKKVKKAGYSFECPQNQVMVGHYYGPSGGKNMIYFQCGKVLQNGVQLQVKNNKWLYSMSKRDSFCPEGKVVTGVLQSFDYGFGIGSFKLIKCRCANVQYEGLNVDIIHEGYHRLAESSPYVSRPKEKICPENQVMTGRRLMGKFWVSLIYKCANLKIPYTSIQMNSRYKDEDKKCIWPGSASSMCPPFVYYYEDPELLKSLLLTVKNNLVYNSKNRKYDTSSADVKNGKKVAIFVMDDSGSIYASNKHPTKMFHHSTFFAGKPVTASGTMIIKKGVIRNIFGCTHHYPTKAGNDLNRQVLRSLKSQGYTRKLEYKLSPCGEKNIFLN